MIKVFFIVLILFHHLGSEKNTGEKNGYLDALFTL